MKPPLSGAGQSIAAGIQESEFSESVDAGSQTHAGRRPQSGVYEQHGLELMVKKEGTKLSVWGRRGWIWGEEGG